MGPRARGGPGAERLGQLPARCSYTRRLQTNDWPALAEERQGPGWMDGGVRRVADVKLFNMDQSRDGSLRHRRPMACK